MCLSKLRYWMLILGLGLGAHSILFANDEAHDLAGILLFDYVVPEFIETSHSDPTINRCEDSLEFNHLIRDFEIELTRRFNLDTLQELHAIITHSVFLEYRQTFVRLSQSNLSPSEINDRMDHHFQKIPISIIKKVLHDLKSDTLSEFHSFVQSICQADDLEQRIQKLYGKISAP